MQSANNAEQFLMGVHSHVLGYLVPDSSLISNEILTEKPWIL